MFHVELTHDSTVIGLMLRCEQLQLTRSILRHKDHTLRCDALHLARSKIYQYKHLTSNKFFRSKMLGNTRYDGALVDTRINGELEKFLRLGNLLRLKDSRYADVHLLEIVERTLLLLLGNVLGSIGCSVSLLNVV